MAVIHKIQSIFLLCLALTLLLLFPQQYATAGAVDAFWSVVYWVGNSLSTTSVGQFVEKGFDGFLGLFGVHLTAHVTPDYWGSLTGTLSKQIGSSFNIPNGPSLECKVLEPRMRRETTSLPWSFDDSTKDYLESCYDQARKIAVKSLRRFSFK